MGVLTAILFCSALCVIVLLRVINNRPEQRSIRIAAAREAYAKDLESLRRQPNDINLKARTLLRGKYLAWFNRQPGLVNGDSGATAYEQLKIRDEVNAACADATAAPSGVAPAISFKPSTEERLLELKSLSDKGLITDAEYATRREKILDEM